MIEFPSFEHVKSWYDAPEYRALKARRLSAVQSNGVLIAGLDTPVAAGATLAPDTAGQLTA